VSERIRVLHLIKGLGPGGAERLLVSSARASDRGAFAVEVAFLLPWKTQFVADLEALGVPTHCLDAPRPQDPRWCARLRAELLRERYDVVHLHSPLVAGLARLVVRTLPAARRPRVVSTEHNVWSSHARATRELNTATFRLGDAWLAVSDEVRDSIPRALRARVEVLVQGIVLDDAISTPEQRAAVRRELGIAPGELAIATVANFRATKAYPDLLATARTVVDHGVPARFVIVGQGPLEAEIRAQRDALGLTERVDLLGFRPDAIRVLTGCDLFLMSSHYEGYPVAIMEALAVGLPVVATEVGGVPGAVHNGVEGLLVPARRPDLLAGAIEALARDPERRAAMGDAAARKGRDYDIAHAVRRTEDIYRALVKKAPRHRA
jgi:glycosyltransferase involved in cell wall biosynthesis